MGNSAPLLLTTEQAAKRLSMGVSTLKELMYTGEVESIKMGRSRRIPIDAISDYIDKLREQGA